MHDNVPWGLWIGFDFIGVVLAIFVFKMIVKIFPVLLSEESEDPESKTSANKSKQIILSEQYE